MTRAKFEAERFRRMRFFLYLLYNDTASRRLQEPVVFTLLVLYPTLGSGVR